MAAGPLGRREPSDYSHVDKHPFTAGVPPLAVEKTVKQPPYSWRKFYDQGQEGSCVGFSSSWMMSLLNQGRVYNAPWLYRTAQAVDEYPDTPPAEGTSVRAGMDVLRTRGHIRRFNNGTFGTAPDLAEGISANRWATSVDQVRAAIGSGIPVTLGINWYTAFDTPRLVHRYGRDEYVIGDGNLGTVRGGHAICAYGASDKRQAVHLVNSWGLTYPLVWLTYSALGRLLGEGGEAALVVDR